MYRIYYVNFGHFSQVEHATLDEAVEAVKRACFEAAIYAPGEGPGPRRGFRKRRAQPAGPVASWSPITGLRLYRRLSPLEPGDLLGLPRA